MAFYTVQTAMDKVKLLIREADDNFIISQAELIGLLSDAQQWVATETGCYTTWGTITLAADTVRYTAPTGTSVPLALEYNYETDKPGNGTRMLTMVDPDSVPHAPDNLVPYFWYYRGNKISVYPSLPVAPLNTTINVLFSKLPVALTAVGDSLTIPDEFQVVVPYRVAEEVAIRSNQFEKQQILSAKVKELTKEGLAQYSGRAYTMAPTGPPTGGAR